MQGTQPVECAGGALTLRVAAALLTTDPHLTPAALITAITARPASALSIGDTSLAALLSMTYTAVSSRARELYRLLGDCPATDLTAAPLAEALHCPSADVDTALDELIGHHLVTVDPQRRCRIVAAVRDDALARSDDTDDADTRLARIRRIAEWYLRHTAAADIAINPAPPRHSPIYDRLGSTAAFNHAHDAQAWFAAERHTVLTWLSLCGHYVWDDLLLQLTKAVWNPLRAAGYTATELVATQKRGLTVAIRIEHRLAAVFQTRTAFELTNLADGLVAAQRGVAGTRVDVEDLVAGGLFDRGVRSDAGAVVAVVGHAGQVQMGVGPSTRRPGSVRGPRSDHVPIWAVHR